jgi:hypothetical protein
MKANSTRFTRRQVLQGAGVLLAHSAMASNLRATDQRAAGAIAQTSPIPRNEKVEYGKDTLPLGIRSRIIDNYDGVKMHILEAGFEDGERPCIILLHGFPELAYTWRNPWLRAQCEHSRHI